MHSPSRVQIPPSPLPAPGFPWNPGASSLPVLLAWVLGAGWICFLRCPPCGRAWKATGYRAQRVGFVVTFRLVGAGKFGVVGGRVCRVPGFAQIADHLTQNSPFLPFFGEVVCTLGVCGCPMVCDRSSACDNDVGSNMSCVSTSCLACGSPVAHVNPLFRTWAVLPRLGIAGPRADEGLRAPESRRRSGLRWQTGGTTVLGVARARPAATPTPRP